MALQGKQLMSRTLQLADNARNRISQIPGLSVLQSVRLTPGFMALDRTRLTVTVCGLGLTGFEADEILAQQLGVTAELPSLQNLTFIISLGNTEADIERLVQAFTTLTTKFGQGDKRTRGTRGPDEVGIREGSRVDGFPDLSGLPVGEGELTNKPSPCLPLSLSPPPLCPREAFFAATETLPVEQTSEYISAELVCPYPPGIPVLMPGEVITPAAIDYLQQIQAMGGFISGCADTSLRTLKVVRQQL
jgi:arginine decarboxylase